MSTDTDDRPLHLLDDEHDREELRRRYYGLLQELRVLLPGVQILVAFLFTAPFANRFAELDDTGRGLYGAALLSGVGAVIALTAPTAFHRVGHRRARTGRLGWSVRLVKVGLVLLAVSLTCGVTLVMRLAFGPSIAVLSGAAVAGALAATWMVLPRLIDH